MGQAFPNWDFDLAPYVRKSYERHREALKSEYLNPEQLDSVCKRLTKRDCMDAAEAFVANMNTMNGSRGAQSVFSSINFGLDTSWEGRMVSECTMRAQLAGLGHGETPIYPILIFKLKKGINFDEEDVNYDLYKLALECLSKRLFPNFQFCDATFNINNDSDDPRDQIATMGCRTRVFEDRFGNNTPVGRGNASFTTLNLPMIFKQATLIGIKDIFEVLDEWVELGVTQLVRRLEYQGSMRASQFDFIIDQETTVMSSDSKGFVDAKSLKHFPLSLGFIGLAEAVFIRTGLSITSDVGHTYAMTIVRRLESTISAWADYYDLNISLLATPSEGLSYTAMRKYKEMYGKIEDLPDNEFFTNSYHVPVWEHVSAKKKIELEAPFHELCLAGHISYIEVDGDASRNLEALDQLVKYMAKKNMGYGSVNVPVDRCRECGHDGYIYEDCPECGSRDISRIRRITGYLVGDTDRWNPGKKDEERKRVKHMNSTNQNMFTKTEKDVDPRERGTR